MSSIYIQEPPTRGKVVLKTTFGEIEVELWSKECPRACRNFVQLCLEGYYDNTRFHRIIRDFIAQGGDPTGTGQGGESAFGAPFRDEFHQRLRFNRRGLLAMANAGPDDNESQFFFTLGTCQELNKKHTLFGKVVGNTIYNMIKLNECELHDERPTRPDAFKILSTEVIFNPFEDIVARNARAADADKQQRGRDDNEAGKAKKGVKNYALLSFGDEAEDEEQDLESVQQTFKGKAKSAHDIGDPSLIAKKAIGDDGSSSSSSSSSSSESDDERSIETATTGDKKATDLDAIKSKLTKRKQTAAAATEKDKSKADDKEQKESSLTQQQEEIRRLERELLANKKKAADDEQKQAAEAVARKEESEVLQRYKEDVADKYEHLRAAKKTMKTAKSSKEEKTLAMLQAFRERLFKAKEESAPPAATDDTDTDTDKKEAEAEEQKATAGEESGDPLKSILTHRLELDEEIRQKVIDANIADNDRYDIFDPRNALNKRKREESTRHSGGGGDNKKHRDRDHHHHHHHSSSSSSNSRSSRR